MFKKKDSETKEIIDIELAFEEGAVLIKAGPQTFRLGRELAITLADRGMLEERFHLAKQPNNDFADIDTVENYCRLKRLIHAHGLNTWQAASIMETQEDKIRAYWGYASRKYDRDGIASRQYDELCADDWLPIIEPPTFSDFADRLASDRKNGFKPAWDKKCRVRAADFAESMWRGKDVGEIAALYHVTTSDLRAWVERNADILAVLKK